MAWGNRICTFTFWESSVQNQLKSRCQQGCWLLWKQEENLHPWLFQILYSICIPWLGVPSSRLRGCHFASFFTSLSLRLLAFYMIFVKTPTCLGDLGLSLYLQVPNLITSLKCHLLWKLVNSQVTLPVIWGMWHEDNRTGRKPSVWKIRQGFDWSSGSQTRND